MTPQTTALAQALVASPHWRWLGGCHYTRAGWEEVTAVLVDTRRIDPRTIPALAAPATHGCLIAQLREQGAQPYFPEWAETPEDLGLALATQLLDCFEGTPHADR